MHIYQHEAGSASSLSSRMKTSKKTTNDAAVEEEVARALLGLQSHAMIFGVAFETTGFRV